MERRSQVFLLTITAALLFCAPPLHAGQVVAVPPPALLSVSAPTDAASREVGAWYDAHIPTRYHARQAVSVSLLSDSDMAIYLEGNDAQDADSVDDGDIDGVYEDDPPSITLRLSADGVPDDLTFAHEYGHYIWFDILSDGDRKRYRAIYDRQKAADSLITDYAADSVEEGFAEAFSYYTALPLTLARRDPLSSAFLDQWPGK